MINWVYQNYENIPSKETLNYLDAIFWKQNELAKYKKGDESKSDNALLDKF